jgi:hypothetical protein
VGVVVVADHKKFRASLGEVQHVLGQANAPATVLGGIARDTKGADLLSGEWGGNLDRTMLIKTAREVARQLVQGLPPIGDPAEPGPAAMPTHAQPQAAYAQPQAAYAPPALRGARRATGPQPAAGPQPAVPSSGSQPAMAPFTGPHPGWSSGASPQPTAARYTGPQPAYPTPGPGAPAPADPQQVPASATTLHTPADLAAVTLSAPSVSDDAPRTTFSRVRGRPGRHQADPGQAPNGQLPNGQLPNGQLPNGQLPSGQPSSSLAPGSLAINGEAPPAAPADGHAATQASVQSQPRVARHAHGGTRQEIGNRQEAGNRQEPGNREEPGIRQETGTRHGSFFSRPPMTPLTASDAQAPVGLPEQEDAEDTGRGPAPWDRQGPAGSMGSRRSGWA